MAKASDVLVKTVIRDISVVGDAIPGAEHSYEMDDYIAMLLTDGYEIKYITCLGRHHDPSMPAPAFTFVFFLVKPSVV